MITTTKHAKRDGFTLIELIVVLMILVGLAAVLIPAVTDMVGRTNASTASANISEVANSIQRYETQNLAYPDDLDSLTTDITAAGSDLTTLTSTLTTALADVTLSADTLAALNTGGITSVGQHIAVTNNTFVKANSATLTSTSVLKGLTAAAQVNLGLETTGVAGKYVVLGVGTLAELNGQTNLDAPVYFPETGTLNPETIYGRFLAVFQITDDASTALNRVKFATVITPTGEGLSTGLENYFDITAGN